MKKSIEVKYYIKERGETIEDACFPRTLNGPAEWDFQNYAEMCAENEFSNCDGWEWMYDDKSETTNFVIITIVSGGDEIGDFKVYMEPTLEYSAFRQKVTGKE